MKKIRVRKDARRTVDVFVGSAYKISVHDEALFKAIVGLGGDALVVPSRNGEMSVRYDRVCGNYDIYDGDSRLRTICKSTTERAIGKGFRKKHFTFYLREL